MKKPSELFDVQWDETPVEKGSLHTLNLRIVPRSPGVTLTLAANRMQNGAAQFIFLVNKAAAGQGTPKGSAS